jgi:hypothetical protein
MYWLRSALLYLFVTLLLCAGIWLFWGDAISKKLKNTSAARPEAAGRQTGPVKVKAPTINKEKVTERPESRREGGVSTKDAWAHTISGFEVLLKNAAQDNRRLLVEAVIEQDRRYRALFFKPAEQRLPKLAERQPSKPKAK